MFVNNYFSSTSSDATGLIPNRYWKSEPKRRFWKTEQFSLFFQVKTGHKLIKKKIIFINVFCLVRAKNVFF